MILARYPRLLAPALIGAAAIGAANAQERLAAAQAHDGVYAIDITTRQGSCEKAYHWKISVSGGRVSSAGDMPLEASGQINQRGVVDVAFARFGQVATAKGRLAREGGSGTWYSPTMQCSGSWQASRHG
jgi:zona occludens toxin (predicted ATPase)